MARPRSSIGFLGLFGRSADLRQIDDGLRAVDLHPRLVPEAVKLTMSSLVGNAAGEAEPGEAAYRRAARLVAYCMLGAEAFAAANGDEAAAAEESRIEAALLAGDGLDSALVLLTIHAKVIQPSVVAAFGLHTG